MQALGGAAWPLFQARCGLWVLQFVVPFVVLCVAPGAVGLVAVRLKTCPVPLTEPPPPSPSPPSLSVATPGIPSTAHRRRLREVWRSAGWPYQDVLEAELLAAGWLERLRDAAGRETVRVTDAGVALLADTLQRNRAARSAHELLVERVAREMQQAGRVVWRGLCLRAHVGGAADAAGPLSPVRTPQGRRVRPPPPGMAPLFGEAGALGHGPDAEALARPAPPPGPAPEAGAPALSSARAGADAGAGAGARLGHAAEVGPTPEAGQWALAMPDVYSIRHTSVEDYLAPVAHEIKVRRSDLLSDLRRPAKGEAYRWLASECWYVLQAGIAEPEEIPPLYGVMLAHADGRLQVARPAPSRAMRLPFAVWMALARATPEPAAEPAQAVLGGAGAPTGPGPVPDPAG